MLKRFYISLSFIFLYINVWGQVTNNQIANRFDLQLDGDPISSTTSNSTVEWQCINKALTNKCLVYHNDQWFSFRVENPGNYFLNLSSQKCKKLQGLQVILIEGNPCEIKTYSVLQCIPKVSQEDTFVELSNLKANTLYLVNIDGFLGDFCEFDIQLSSHLNGLPLRFSLSDSIKTKFYLNDRSVYLTWQATAEFITSIENFRVGRKSEKEVKSKWTEVNLKLNAYGQPELDYSLSDTLTKHGTYTYTILGIKKDSGYPILLQEQRISYYEKSETSISQSAVHFSPGFEKSATLEMVILDAYTEAIIKVASIDFDPKKNKNIDIRVAEMAEEGVKNFVVHLKNTKTKEVKKFYFRLNEEGAFAFYSKGQ